LTRDILALFPLDKMPMVRDGMTGDWIGSFSGHKGAVWSCHLDKTGSLAATASGDFSTKVWDAVTGQRLWEFPHKHIVKSCDFSPDSKFLATGGHEGIVRVYDLTLDNPEQQEPLILSHDSVVISKVGWWTNEILIAAGADGTIRFWKIGENEQPMHVLQVDAEVRDMEICTLAGSGQNVLTVAAGNKVSIFDLQDQQLIHAYPMPIHFREEGGASLHPHGHKFVAGGSDLWVRVFCFETGQELECHKGHHGPIRCLRYAPDGKTYATGSEDGTIRLWKTEVEEGSD
jgi:serine-threonine kinase receptor-associated protein